MKKYKQLTSAQRSEINALLRENFSQNHIAKRLGVSQSTISREINRNGNSKSYNAEEAVRQCNRRKEWRRRPRIYCGELRNRVHAMLRKYYSPKQICGVLAKEGIKLSPETIYKDIRFDRKQGGDLFTYTRHKMKHRKRDLYNYKTPIHNRMDISLLPQEADGKRFGDWQMDLIIGAKQSQAILTLTERSNNLSMFCRLPNGKDATATALAAYRLLLPYKKQVLTITTDNGPEFAAHELLAKKIGATVYFAKPYHSWEKGEIEHFNKLLRQYIPKGANFDDFSDEQLKWIQKELNLRPREKLNFDCPKNAFFNSLSLYAVTS